MMEKHPAFILFLILLFSCKEKDETAALSSYSGKPPIINIQPFDGMPSKEVVSVFQALNKTYPNVFINKSIPLPKSAFYAPRNRYKADSLISYLKRITPDGHVTVGLTVKDISTTKGKVLDYGIMGLGYQPGKSCVVSTFRLHKKNLSQQFFKLFLHELGHTQGLPHCKTETCFMRDAKGKNYFDEEIGFCANCKAHLNGKGFSF